MPNTFDAPLGFVIVGLVPTTRTVAVKQFCKHVNETKDWVAGTSPTMTREGAAS
jgi:hypothetical protein